MQRLTGCVTHVVTQVLTQAVVQKMTEQISQSNSVYCTRCSTAHQCRLPSHLTLHLQAKVHCHCTLTGACELKTADVVADLAILIFHHCDDIHPGLDSWGSQPATALPGGLQLSLTAQQP